jgi:uroporphyrinogen III methyltransferase/synthase
LNTIVSEVEEKEIKPPAVVIIGEVVRLRNTLRWYEDRPMFGHRILVTREHASGFEALEELGAEILEFPTVEIVPPRSYGELDEAIRKIPSYDWLIFTSANAVRYFFRRVFDLDRDIRDLKGARICAIGTKTAAEIKKYGIKVDVIPDEFRAEGLIKAFAEFGGDTSPASDLRGMKFLLPRAEVARELFPAKVRELGGEIDVPVAYRAVKPELHGKRLKRFLKEGKITIATFTSAATFTNFLEIMGSDARELLKEVSIAVIGPVTAKAIETAGLTVHIMPKESTVEAMVDEIIEKTARRS